MVVLPEKKEHFMVWQCCVLDYGRFLNLGGNLEVENWYGLDRYGGEVRRSQATRPGQKACPT